MRNIKTRKILVFLISILALVWVMGCAHLDPTGPRNEREAFPERNQDPRVGLVISPDTTHKEVWIIDQAGRVIEHDFVAGANRTLTINGRHIPQYWIRTLEIGRYRLEYIPFYYTYVLTLRGPVRYRVDLRKRSTHIYVDRDAMDNYDRDTARYWGWICRLNGGRIPDDATPLGVGVNVRGRF